MAAMMSQIKVTCIGFSSKNLISLLKKPCNYSPIHKETPGASPHLDQDLDFPEWLAVCDQV